MVDFSSFLSPSTKGSERGQHWLTMHIWAEHNSNQGFNVLEVCIMYRVWMYKNGNISRSQVFT